MDSSSGTFSWAISTTRSAMAAVSSSSEPMGVETVTDTMPWSISGMRTIRVFRQAAANRATMAMDTPIPTHRWRTKKPSTPRYQPPSRSPRATLPLAASAAFRWALRRASFRTFFSSRRK